MALSMLTCPSRVENLAHVTDFVEQNADQCGIEQKKKFGLLVALEEAYVNVCHYAYPDTVGDVELACGCEAGDFVVEIADSGIAFDVLSLPDPDTDADIMDREIGGLGVYFIRKLTDAVCYRRENGRNILRMALHTSQTA